MAIPFEAKAKVQLCETKLVQWKKRAKINKTKEHKKCFFWHSLFFAFYKNKCLQNHEAKRNEHIVANARISGGVIDKDMLSECI